ncbi:NAD(P)-dependent oxidoreductase [Shewanella marisflavi]|uniref:NAD-dependent epimerase/dehydratase family protein n=1 Tax=Shewanella marisflavi TaxID=260364 RepID=UPI002010324D|nr:NAD(P)-dependent oxidoreductase [Shewanella marisflavi]MCL1040839.1 NAD(P)-dependent oxidoreductase [Shewanella marisflavi]
MSKRLVITGANGFLGRHLVSAAKGLGYQVLAIQRQQTCDALAFDCPELEVTLSDFCPDVVIHLAAAYGEEAKGVGLNANFLLPLRLLNWASTQVDLKFITTGSFWQFGDQKHAAPVDYYSASKQALAVYLEYFRQREKLEVYQLVLSSTYGPNDTRGKLVDYLIEQGHSDLPAYLGDASKRFSLTDVRDVVSAIMMLINSSTCLPHVSYRIRQEHLYSFAELSTLFAELGCPLKLNFNVNQDEIVGITQPVDDLLPTLPGWHPQYQLKDYVKQRLWELSALAP